MNNQATRLLNHLQSGAHVNRLTALRKLGIFELSARVIDLEAAGYKVMRKTITVTNRFQEKTRVKDYWLSTQDEQQQAAA